MTRLRGLLLASAFGIVALALMWLALRGRGVQDVTPLSTATDAPVSASPAVPRTSRPRAALSNDGAAEEDAVPPDDEPEAAPRKPPARFVLRVVADEDERPIEGARVQSIEDKSPRTTDANGEATVVVAMSDDDPDAADTWIDVRAPGRVGETVHAEAASGEVRRETVRLDPGFAVAGSVKDAAGRPIVGARIVAADGGFCIRPAPEITDATADAEGRFRVDGLPYGRIVEFTVSDGRHAAKTVRRGPRDASALHVVLDDGGTLRGVVRAANGSAVEGACVFAEPAGSVDGWPGWETPRDLSDGEGRWEIPALPLGVAWTVTAEHSEFMHSESLEVDALVAESPTAERDLAMRPLATVVVEFDFAAPHAKATARAFPSMGDDVACDVPGRAEFRVRSSGVWKLDCAVDGFGPAQLVLTVAPGDVQTKRVRFGAGATLSGRVMDDTDAPVAGAKIEVDPNGRWPREGVSQRDGSFLVAGLAEGPHSVRVTLPARLPWSAEDVAAPGDALRCVVPRNGEVSLRLRLPDGAPQPATRRVEWNDYPVVELDDGPWTGDTIVRSLPPGAYVVEVQVPDFVAWERRDVEVLPGKRTDLGEITLDRGLRLRGRLMDPLDRPVPRADIHFDPRGWVETDAAGVFVSPPLAAGRVGVRTYDLPGVLDVDLSVELGAETKPLEIRLQRGTLLRVTLAGLPQEDLGALEVWVDHPERKEDEDHDASISADQAGRFAGRVPSGRRRIQVTRDGDVLATREVDLSEGGETELEISLAK